MHPSSRLTRLARLGLFCTALLLAASVTAEERDRGTPLDRLTPAEPASLRVLWVASEGWAQSAPDADPDGLSIALIRRFAEWLAERHALEVSLDFVEETDWRRFYARVRDGRGGVFGLGNVTITEARRAELAFSPPYVDNIAVLVSPADTATLDAAAELPGPLQGLRALGFAGTLHESRLRALAADHWPDLPVDLASSNVQILDAVVAGTHFAYLDAYVYHRARVQGLPLRRHPALDDPGEQFGIIMPLDNDWQALLAEFFAEDGGLLQASWYRAAMREHLGDALAELLLP